MSGAAHDRAAADHNAIDIGGGVGKPPFHHECNALCRPDQGEHAGVSWAVIDDLPIWQNPQRFGWWLGLIRGCQVTILSIDDAPEAPEYGPWGLGPYRRLVRWQES